MGVKSPPAARGILPCNTAQAAILITVITGAVIAAALFVSPGAGGIQSSPSRNRLGASDTEPPPQRPYNPLKPRVAILFSGEPRWVTGISGNIYKHYILDRYDCDVYGSFGFKTEINTTQVEVFKAFYNPIAVDTNVDEDFPGLFARMFPPPAAPRYFSLFQAEWYKMFQRQVIMMYDSLRRVAITFDRTRGSREYDWILRARTDSVLTALPNLTTLPRGYLYFGMLHLSRGIPEWLRNEFYILPGNVPRALDLMRKGLDRMAPINLGEHPSSFVDETIFHDLVYDLGLQNISRVTDYIQNINTRDGITVQTCDYNGKGLRWGGFDSTRLVEFSNFSRTHPPWFRTLDEVTAGKATAEELINVQGVSGCPFGPFYDVK